MTEPDDLDLEDDPGTPPTLLPAEWLEETDPTADDCEVPHELSDTE